VPRAGFAWVTQKVRETMRAKGLLVPWVTSNRINTPEVAEAVLQQGCADLVSMARPWLADPEFVRKATQGRAQDINTCIACNQACLDHVFQGKPASCLVNPRAGNETVWPVMPVVRRKAIAVVGGGPAGMAAACGLAERGHRVDLFEAGEALGGQFNLACLVPGKEEFRETLRYFRRRLDQGGVRVHLRQKVSASDLISLSFDDIVLATGVKPRQPDIPGLELPLVIGYAQALQQTRPVGQRVVIVGAGGIGFDVAAFLLASENHRPSQDVQAFMNEWGVADPCLHPGGLLPGGSGHRELLRPHAMREVTLVQRTAGKLGAGLGKTTGWIHRATLVRHGVRMLGGVAYERITGEGLWVKPSNALGAQQEPSLLACDTVVICTGQTSCQDLLQPLQVAGSRVHLIGGAWQAGELDAKRAIDQGARLGATL
jgi:2,4-dienoyl-CoA reductase (NADPH2)